MKLILTQSVLILFLFSHYTGTDIYKINSYFFEDNPTNKKVVYTNLKDAEGQPAGVYTFNFGEGEFDAYIDSEGWMLWLQYHHKANTNPQLNVITSGNNLPIYDPSGLGTDNSQNMSKWGHGSQSFAKSIPDEQIWLRWEGETSNHDRVIDFESPILGDFQENSEEDFEDIRKKYVLRSNHTATIPQAVNGFSPGNFNDFALTNSPFWDFSNAHFAIRTGDRWEVDDEEVGDTKNTIHRVWVKHKPYNSSFTNSTIEQLKNHIQGTTILSSQEINQINIHFNIHANRIADDSNTVNEALDLIQIFDTTIGPLFTTDKTKNGIQRDQQNNPGSEIEMTILTLQQALFDYAFTSDFYENHPEILTNVTYKTSEFFPGAVTPPSDPNVSHEATIRANFLEPWGTQPYYNTNNDNTEDALRPTGCYLAPGSIATISVPNTIVGKGYTIRVGAHSWDLDKKQVLKRLDRVSKVFPINTTEVQIFNPLGGGIYIQVPKGSNDGIVAINLTNVVKSPFFSAKDFDQTSLNDWNTTEKNHPGPWTDFESDKVMFQVPTAWIHNNNVTDPVTLMQEWDKTVDALCDLIGRPHYSDKHQLYMQTDVQIRGGAYSVGYPMSNNPYTPNQHSNTPPFITTPYNSPGSSTTFHELGHQLAMSKFNGEGEATVNFIYVAAMTKGLGIDFNDAFSKSMWRGNGYMYLDDAAETRMITDSFMEGNPRVITNSTKNEVRYQHRGYAHYAEIVRLFGWCGLEKFWYSESVDYMNGIDHGINNQDQDLRTFRMSRETGIDLRPLFHFYGIHPENPAQLETKMQQAGIEKSIIVYNRLQEYKSIVPMNNNQFVAHALERYPDGLGAGSDHPDYGRGWYYYRAQTYNESDGQAAQLALQNIIDLYYPNGRPTVDNDPEFSNENCHNANTLNITEVTDSSIGYKQGIIIAPNPISENSIQMYVSPKSISNKNATIELYSVIGKLIKKWNTPLTDTVQLNIESLASNQVYFLKIKAANGKVHTIKVLK